MKKHIAVLMAVLAACSTNLFAQIGISMVEDLSQEKNSAAQLRNDIVKIAKLDAQIQNLVGMVNQMKMNAKFFADKSAWTGFNNQIVSSWWAPNRYGMTGLWNPMVLMGIGSPQQTWANATLALHANPNIVKAGALAMVGGNNGPYVAYASAASQAASIEMFDGSSPIALQTLGNARVNQIQMATAIRNLQGAAVDGSAGYNTEVQQLNLLTTGAVQGLEMQQTSNNLLVSLLEQSVLANKIQRDQLAGHQNFTAAWQADALSQPVAWGNAASAINNFRIP